MFRSVSNKVSLPEIEETVINHWIKNEIFIKSVTTREGCPSFTFYEGPPTANGRPGIHHVLARVFKDVIPRYKVMKGYYAPRIAGWDTHGLPVELEVERALGFTNKTQIEEYGIDKFNARCRESVFNYLSEWEAVTNRIGFWVDLEHPYITMDNNYIESCWWAIKQMWDKGLIYHGYRVTPHCPRCGTSLSSHEVAQGYKENTPDPSVYVKFKLDLISIADTAVSEQLNELSRSNNKPIYLLAWTTTPWTLAGNTALAVSADAEYSILESNEDFLILATARIDSIDLKEYKIITRVLGSELIKIKYTPLFNPHHFDQERRRFQKDAGITLESLNDSLTYPVISAEFVSMEDGTGIVHIAPAYGEADYQVGERYNLDFVHTVDLQGRVTGKYPFSGLFVKEADPVIIDNLQKRGLLFHNEIIHHTYPFCWRCDTPLLYYAKQTWYIQTTAIKDALLKGNDEINWYPEHIKHGRFGDWLTNNVDWAFSRERYWGTPLPIWHCRACGSYDCIGSLEELKSKNGFSGFREPLDLHRPYVDDCTFNCGCGGQMTRVPEVIDVWFDSGAMPIAQYHYPFENSDLVTGDKFPADYICEAVDQTRGWFYSLHAISTLLFDRPCYHNVICLGHILDVRGEKMSKARGNVVDPWSIINKYGADPLRWYFITASPPGNVRRFSEKIIAELSRRFFLTLWNVYAFFVTYANIDHYEPTEIQIPTQKSELDRWIISELNQLISDVDESLNSYDPTKAGRRIEEFVDELSNWYVRRSRRRFWKSESDADKLTAYTTLYECLVTLSKLLAPLAPFIAEELYLNLIYSVSPQSPESVHLTNFPIADPSTIDQQLATETKLVMKLSSLGRAARSQARIKVRQPLLKVIVDIPPGEQPSLLKLKSQLLEELNVKELEFADGLDRLPKAQYSVISDSSYTIAIPIEITPELEAEGLAREIVHRIQMMRRSAGFDITDHIITHYQSDTKANQVISLFSNYIKQETLSDQLVEENIGTSMFSQSYQLGQCKISLGVTRLR